MLMIFLFFRLDFFKKEKKACCRLMFFSIESYDFDAQSKTDVLKMFLC